MHTDSHQKNSLGDETTSVETPRKHQPLDTPSPSEEEKMSVRSLISFALIVLAIVVPIRLFIAKPFIVSGASMYPTFDTWHYLIIDQLSYRLAEPKRGDVITFRLPQNPSQFLIKRIIGLPGETVVLDDTTTTIENAQNPTGFVLDEPYVLPENAMGASMRITLGDNEYFVMGDNRKVSADSRYWGALEKNKIVGRAFIRLFPFTQIDTLPGATSYTITPNTLTN